MKKIICIYIVRILTAIQPGAQISLKGRKIDRRRIEWKQVARERKKERGRERERERVGLLLFVTDNTGGTLSPRPFYGLLVSTMNRATTERIVPSFVQRASDHTEPKRYKSGRCSLNCLRQVVVGSIKRRRTVWPRNRFLFDYANVYINIYIYILQVAKLRMNRLSNKTRPGWFTRFIRSTWDPSCDGSSYRRGDLRSRGRTGR